MLSSKVFNLSLIRGIVKAVGVDLSRVLLPVAEFSVQLLLPVTRSRHKDALRKYVKAQQKESEIMLELHSIIQL